MTIQFFVFIDNVILGRVKDFCWCFSGTFLPTKNVRSVADIKFNFRSD